MYINALLKRGWIFAGHFEAEKCKTCFEKALAIDANCTDVFIHRTRVSIVDHNNLIIFYLLPFPFLHLPLFLSFSPPLLIVLCSLFFCSSPLSSFLFHTSFLPLFFPLPFPHCLLLFSLCLPSPFPLSPFPSLPPHCLFFLPLSSPNLSSPSFLPLPSPLSYLSPPFLPHLTIPFSYSSPFPSTSSYPFSFLSLPLPLPLSFPLPLLLFLIPSHPGWPRIRGPSGAQCCFRRPREGRQNGPQLPLYQLQPCVYLSLYCWSTPVCADTGIGLRQI